MEIRNVYIIYDKTKLDKEVIKKELIEEGYTHNFMFGGEIDDRRIVENHLFNTDEVWVWGDCKESRDYKLALKVGSDIWQMG